MRVSVDEETCVGCGACAEICPEVFQVPDEKALVLLDEVPAGFQDRCREAAEACPVEAIEIDEQG
jgi:ferredoxin